MAFRSAALLSCLLLFALPALSDEGSRWEPAIREFEKQDRSGRSSKHSIVFTGSSSIRRWDLDESFPDLKVLNHGFGGSQMSDLVEFADRIVTPHAPKAVVVYSGDNDLAAGESPERVRDEFLTFADKVQRNGQPPIVLVSIKPSEKRWNLREKMRKTNQLLREACERRESTVYVDVYDSMLGNDGTPDPKLFAADKLHLSDAGYEIWQRKVRAALAELEVIPRGGTQP